MKKLLLVTLCGLLSLSMSACSNTKKKSEAVDQKEYLAERQRSEEERKREERKEIGDKIKAFENTALKDSYAGLKDIGYDITYRYAKSDADCTAEYGDLSSDSEYLDGWVITDISNIDHDDKTFTVYIQDQASLAADQQANEMSKALAEKLDSATAWNAAEDYGESQYPYGFKLHYITGKLDQSAADANTWFLKAQATITNPGGDKRDVTCEAYVTGTSAAPQVTNFLVY